MSAEQEGVGFSRREVLRTAGAAAAWASLAAGPAGAQEAEAQPREAWRAGPLALVLQVNGAKRKVRVEPRTTLLDALRDHLELTGAKRVCDRGACGACTVWIDEQPHNACLVLAVEAEGRAITTVEGLAPRGELHPVQEAFCREDALQCGFCTPGMVMSCAALLVRTPRPNEAETRAAIAGNLCRCGTYPHVVNAVQRAAGRSK